ncbi:hypothetical protein RI367_001633 [Sorochytrium milnesiophthora]
MTSLLFAMFQTYISFQLMEQAEDYYGHYKTSGLAVPAYWMGIWLCNVVVSLLLVALLTISAVIYYCYINVGLLILILLLSVHATIGIALLITAVVRSNMGTRLAAGLITMSVTVRSLALVHVWGHHHQCGAPMSPWASVYPPVAVAYSIRALPDNDTLDRLGIPGVLLFVMGALLLLLAVLITHAHKRLDGAEHLLSQRLHRPRMPLRPDSEAVHPEGSEDPDVAPEVLRVDQQQSDHRFAVKIHHPSRHFAAVDDLTLGLEKEECFGLLGPNGCSKANTIAALLAPSAGHATIGGYPASAEARS